MQDSDVLEPRDLAKRKSGDTNGFAWRAAEAVNDLPQLRSMVSCRPDSFLSADVVAGE
jgi:hypothetical protein